ncbi:unnamed protein product [Eruca vesicaria subsp. sativa]|uniref:Pectinesterase inhibitor domain-containing protein n=1 Tax=Eruca vesicaria subsp. sativa TaxID=29727 RepID=A0ABC8IZD2_ERUVS|nr:unnamed protein product [Eruca vesicaria subsp. sativa]
MIINCKLLKKIGQKNGSHQHIAVPLRFIFIYKHPNDSSHSIILFPNPQIVRKNDSSNLTTYPDKCYKSLSTYSTAIKSDPIKLCTTALKLNVKSAKEATSVVSKLLKKSQKSAAGRKSRMVPETLILKDCLEEMEDTIVELKQAITEMKTIRDGDSIAEHIANVRTWLSSALTDEGTCTDGFEEVKVNKETKKMVMKVVEELATTTSNTLALITNLSY